MEHSIVSTGSNQSAQETPEARPLRERILLKIDEAAGFIRRVVELFNTSTATTIFTTCLSLSLQNSIIEGAGTKLLIYVAMLASLSIIILHLKRQPSPGLSATIQFLTCVTVGALALLVISILTVKLGYLYAALLIVATILSAFVVIWWFDYSPSQRLPIINQEASSSVAVGGRGEGFLQSNTRDTAASHSLHDEASTSAVCRGEA